MRIAFENVNFASSSGPNSFAFQLGTEFQRNGVEVCSSQEDSYDACIVFIEQVNPVRDVPLIHRLDGIYFANKEEFDSKNVLIKETYNKANAVVFQSEFDKTMIEKHFGKRDVKNAVIHNGTYVQRINNEQFKKIEWLYNIRQDFLKIFTMSSQWKGRPNKRYDENVRFIREYADWSGDRVCLMSMGEHDTIAASTEIEHTKKFTQIHLGNVIPSQAWIPVCASDWFIHLEFLGHNPNVLVQALACETAAVCSSAGGQAELVKHNQRGLIIQDVEFDYEICDYRNPPKLQFTDYDFSVIRNGYRLRNDQIVDLHISHVAEKYMTLIKEVIA